MTTRRHPDLSECPCLATPAGPAASEADTRIPRGTHDWEVVLEDAGDGLGRVDACVRCGQPRASSGERVAVFGTRARKGWISGALLHRAARMKGQRHG